MATRIFAVRTDEVPAPPPVPTIPLPPPPREARLRLKVRAGAAVIATLVAAAGVFLFLLAMHHGRALERLRDGGVLVTGKVENLRIANSGRSKTRTITFSFDHDGTAVHAAASVSADVFERFAIGDPIEVTYERANPSNHQLFKVGEREVSEFWTAMSIGSAAYGAAALIAAACAATTYRRRLALLRDGKLIATTIVRVGRFVRKKQARKVTLTFTAPTGEEITKRHWLPKGTVEPGHEGQSVAYLVAPEDEKRGEPVAVVLGSCELL